MEIPDEFHKIYGLRAADAEGTVALFHYGLVYFENQKGDDGFEGIIYAHGDKSLFRS